jgi:hypothetical protein
MMSAIRRFLYRRGIRPTRGSVFYSPSLAWMYGVEDAQRAARADEDTER